MGFRYRRSIRLGRGIRINLSKSGPSLSIGKRGATMNIGPRGTRMTVGIPGTGLSYQMKTGRSGVKRVRTNSSIDVGTLGRSRRRGWLLLASAAAIVGLIAIANGGSGTGTAPAVPVDVQETAATPAQAANPVKETVEVVAPANIRAAPRSDAEIVGSAARHARYGVFGRSGGWTQIGTDHAQGWIGNSRLAPRPD